MERFASILPQIMPAALTGQVVQTDGLALLVGDFPAPVGALVAIERQTGDPLQGEVIGFRNAATIVYPLGRLDGIRRGNRVRLLRTARHLRVGHGLLGRVVDADGQALDDGPDPGRPHRVALDRAAPPAVERPRVDRPLTTGVRSLDALLTCGCGQRMGIFSGSGVGKSVLLGMMARFTSADVNVIALIGERGREVNEFLDRDLGADGRARSVVVVATSDQPAMVRVRAAMAATAIAEFFRDQGRNVLFMMDSLTRFAMAQREIGLAAGEPPTTRGYPPSAFALLPRLIERTGRTRQGSITGFYSVLVEGDDPNEPVSDTVRGLLDGHTILSRKLASRGHYPAIDVLPSISRLMPDLVTEEHRQAALLVRRLLSVYREHEDLITIGAYRTGSNPNVDAAIAMKPHIDNFLQQSVDGGTDWKQTCTQLQQLAGRCRQTPSPQTSSPAKVGQ